MSIHDIRKLKRASLQFNFTPIGDFLTTKALADGRSTDRRPPNLNLKVLQQHGYRVSESRNSSVSGKATKLVGNDGIQAHRKVFADQLKNDNQEKQPESTERFGRSCVLSTARVEDRESSERHSNNNDQIKDDFQHSKPSKNAFSLELTVGKGGFGKVWRVRNRKSGQTFAMKVLSKVTIVLRKSVTSVMNEMRFLSYLRHPFLVNAHYAFQDRSSLYLVLDYLNGGDLRYHITKYRRFREDQARFFVCCILLGLEYLHSNKIIHRDLKPQNLVFDDSGYLRITDLGISSKVIRGNGDDTSGTPGYMAPEVITHCDHSYQCDFFSLGIILYELMIGKRPYTGRIRQQIREQMLGRQARIEAPPIGWSIEAADFANRLMQRKPENRLGIKHGCEDLRNHPWIRDFEWKALSQFRLRAPFIPTTLEEEYSSYRQANISSDSSTNSQYEQQTTLLLQNSAVQDLFRGYEFNIDDKRQRASKSVSRVARRFVGSKTRRG